MPKDKNYSQRGFTLIELMIVVAIIGTLGAMVLPRFIGSQEAARTARVQADLRTIETAIVMFEADYGSLPTTITIDNLVDSYTPVSGGRTYGPYLRTKPVPPAGSVRVVGGANPTEEATTSYSIGTAGTVKGRALFNDKYTVENVR